MSACLGGLQPLSIAPVQRYSFPRPAAIPLRSGGLRLFRGAIRAAVVLLAVRAGVWWCAQSGSRPLAAHAIGYSVIGIRYIAVLFGGAMSGLAGAYLSLAITPMWVEGMSCGRGWIALALVVFATWKPLRVLLGAYLFGGVTILQFYGQGIGLHIASQ